MWRNTVCHCIVIHCLATKHSCTASSHSTVTLRTAIHLHHQSIQSHCSVILQHHYTLQSYSTVTLCTAIHLHHQSIQSHTAWSFWSRTAPLYSAVIQQSHRGQPYIFIIRAYSHTQLGHSGVIQHHYTVQSYSSHTVLSYIIIRAYSHTLLGHSAVIQHHYTLESHSTVTLYNHTSSSSKHTVTHCYVILQSCSTLIQCSHTAESHCTAIHHHQSKQSHIAWSFCSHTAPLYPGVTQHSHTVLSYIIMKTYSTLLVLQCSHTAHTMWHIDISQSYWKVIQPIHDAVIQHRAPPSRA